MDKVRVLRILEYVGDREAVEKTLSKGGVPANGEYVTPRLTIRSAIVGSFPEILEPAEETLQEQTSRQLDEQIQQQLERLQGGGTIGEQRGVARSSR